MWLPGAVFADEGVCEDDELSHNGDEGDFGLFAVYEEAVVEGLERPVATRGGHRGQRTWARPPLMWRVPRLWPLSQAIGARPTIMAACWADREPISARPTMSAIAVTVPTPGMEVRMASRLARRGSAPIRASISASRFSIAVSAARSWRLISTAAGRAVVAPSWLRRAVRAATAASRQRVSSWRVSMSSLCGVAAAGVRVSPRVARVRQSTRAVLAKAPMASANSRERNGLTTATAKPSAWRLRWAAR